VSLWDYAVGGGDLWAVVMKKNVYFMIALVLLGSFLFLFGLGNMALTDPDETFYAETAKEMVEAKDWSTPLIFGKPQFEKPIFYYWLVMLSYLVFGIGEFAARFPSAIFGIFGVIGVYLLGRAIFSPLAGFLSAIILATCVQYLVLARACVTDMVLTVFILFCVLFFVKGQITGRRRYYFIAAVMAALAVLTKGPIGAFIPGVIFLSYITISGGWKNIKKIPILWCLAIFFAIALPWYLTAMRLHGTQLVNEFFAFHNVTRFLKPEHKIGSSPFFYIPVVLGGFFPWTFFLIFGAWDMFKDKNIASRLKASRGLLLTWFLVVFVFFSVSRTKLVTYIFPLFPVMALVTGRFWEKFITEFGDKALTAKMKVSFVLSGISVLAAGIAVCLVVGHKYSQILTGTLVASGIFILGILISTILLFRGKRIASFVLIVLSVVLLSFPLILRILPPVGEFESSRALSYKLNELAAPEDPVAGECDHRRGIAFYTGRTDIVDVHPYSGLLTFFSRKEKVWGIVQYKHYKQMQELKGDSAPDPLFRVGKYVLVTN